ncbi:RING-H2 zinc finger protein [Sesbania bispinosa]|nr:RING-H2 zinc finger protein [Sesbania bispinosa]
MDSHTRFSILPIEGFNQHPLSHEESPMCDCFYIDFQCHTHTNHSPRETHATHGEIAATITTFSESYLIPCDIICDFDTFGIIDPECLAITFLRETFSSVPVSSESMDSILLSLIERARGMFETNNEGRHILEMSVIVCINTWPRNTADEEGIDHSIDDLIKSLEIFKFDDDDVLVQNYVQFVWRGCILSVDPNQKLFALSAFMFFMKSAFFNGFYAVTIRINIVHVHCAVVKLLLDWIFFVLLHGGPKPNS